MVNVITSTNSVQNTLSGMGQNFKAFTRLTAQVPTTSAKFTLNGWFVQNDVVLQCVLMFARRVVMFVVLYGYVFAFLRTV